MSADQQVLHEWAAALEQRYLADLRLPEVTRALRALSSAYVERRRHGARQHVHGALDTAGKRAAFGLYYGPLHFIAVTEVVRALGANEPAPASILDLGCGTGAAGAAWALACSPRPSVVGIDKHPWAVSEARWTLGHFAIHARVMQGEAARARVWKSGGSAVAAYTLNELADGDRLRVEEYLLDLARHGGHVLVLEPLARGVTPWWSEAAARVIALGGRADEWRFPIDPPPIVRQLGEAAGLNYREIKVQTLYV